MVWLTKFLDILYCNPFKDKLSKGLPPFVPQKEDAFVNFLYENYKSSHKFTNYHLRQTCKFLNFDVELEPHVFLKLGII